MTPSISENNTADVDVGSKQADLAAPAKENHEANPTVQDGISLMWSEGSEPVSSSQPIYIVTSDYESVDDESSGRGEALSPNSGPPSEAEFSVCSSSADVQVDIAEEPYASQPVSFLIPAPAAFAVLDPNQQQHQFQLGFHLDNNNVVMYPPGMLVPQGQGMPLPAISAAPAHHVPYTTTAWSPPPMATPAENQTVQVQHQQHGMVTYASPPPQPPMIMSQVPTPAMQQYEPPPPPAQGQMYTPPPLPLPQMTPLGHPAAAGMAEEPSSSRNVTAMVMPMPQTDRDGENQISVGTRNGPMVLFATAPGASETTIQVQGMSGYPDSVSQQMQIVWHGEFKKNFHSFGEQWILHPTDDAPDHPEKWCLFKDSAKVRFMCHKCGNAWTSMKGRVMFWIHLDTEEKLGGVLFKLYGQACDKCGSDDEPTFCPPMWYPEEVVKVVGNLFNRVGQLFYGFDRPALRIDRRQGRPREHHNAKKCQACMEGVCKFEWVFS